MHQTGCKYVGSNGNSLVCTSGCYRVFLRICPSFLLFPSFSFLPLLEPLLLLSLSISRPWKHLILLFINEIKSSVTCPVTSVTDSLLAWSRVDFVALCLGAPPEGLLRGPGTGQLSSAALTHRPSRHQPTPDPNTQTLCKEFAHVFFHRLLFLQPGDSQRPCQARGWPAPKDTNRGLVIRYQLGDGQIHPGHLHTAQLTGAMLPLVGLIVEPQLFKCSQKNGMSTLACCFLVLKIFPCSSCMQVQLATAASMNSARLDGSWGPHQFLASLDSQWTQRGLQNLALRLPKMFPRLREGLKVEKCSNMLKKVSKTRSNRTGTRAMGNWLIRAPSMASPAHEVKLDHVWSRHWPKCVPQKQSAVPSVPCH